MKCYIGQTNNPKRRFREHRRANGTCRILYRAIKKYGWDNFLKVFVEVFEDDVSQTYMDEREIYWIKEHKTFGPKGYNCTEGGGGIRGYTHSAETRAKLADISRGRSHTPETRDKLRKINIGKKMSPEACKKMSVNHVSHKHSSETKGKISNTLKLILGLAVCGIDKRGTKRMFRSCSHAERVLSQETGLIFDNSCISKCANKKRKSHHGWTFEYA